MFVEHFFCDDYHNRDVTGNNTPLKFNVSKGMYFCIEKDPQKRRWQVARFRQTIMNYHGPFDRKHDSQ